MYPGQAASHQKIQSITQLDTALAHGTGQSRPDIVQAARSSTADGTVRSNNVGAYAQARAFVDSMNSLNQLARRGHA